MASAIRVAPGATVVCAVGEFGAAVAGILTRVLPSTAEIEPERLPAAFTARPKALVLALWRPVPALCEQADALAHTYGVPWLPITAEHPVTRIGPWIRPGAGPCHRCYVERRIQHDTHALTTSALHQAYDADADCGPQGYLPPHAQVAAAVALALLTRSPEQERAGDVTVYNPAQGLLATNPVVGRHQCDRCGPPDNTETLNTLRGAIRRAHA
jgi:bacteriocin biosynthesis cyclodehydratase domain-containing protein